MKEKVFILLWASLVVSSGQNQNQRDKDKVDIGKMMSIPEINKGRDDVLLRPEDSPQRGAIVNEGRLWKPPVPYFFDGSLGMNTKGVVLRALDQLRLKSCVDFRPWNNDTEYINVFKGDGCWSEVGRGVNEQPLSLGEDCDANYIAEHEFLHALGFQHEHTRYDRDDYVSINFTNVQDGLEYNFKKAVKGQYTTHGTQYDYWSVMHYGQYTFSNGNGPTVIPKDPRYTDIIGQSLGMSATDVLELNMLYKCESTIAFQLHCDFSHENACPVTTCSNSPLRWERVLQVTGGPSSDHTSLPSGNPEAPEGRNATALSHFMHVSTVNGQKGDSARLETMRVTPKRACIIKCLQFYYYHTKTESSALNVWIREFESEEDFTGKRRLIYEIYGPETKHWKMKYVSLYTSKSFQVEFEVQKGELPSEGGISIDDINLSELQCPHTTLQINNFQEILLNNRDYTIYSPIRYSSMGYAYSLGVYFDNPFIGMFVQLVSGKYDDELTWPVADHQVTLQMVDQSPNILGRMSFERSTTTDLSRVDVNGTYRWGNPKDHGTYYIDDFNRMIYYGPNIGLTRFVKLSELHIRNFLKGGSAVFNLFFEDISPLGYIDELPCPPEYPKKYDEYDNGPCSPKATPKPPHTTPDTATHYHKTTMDKSIFGFAPNKISSPVLIFLALLMLFMQ